MLKINSKHDHVAVKQTNKEEGSNSTAYRLKQKVFCKMTTVWLIILLFAYCDGFEMWEDNMMEERSLRDDGMSHHGS